MTVKACKPETIHLEKNSSLTNNNDDDDDNTLHVKEAYQLFQNL